MKKASKYIAIVLTLALALSMLAVLAACSPAADNKSTPTPPAVNTPAPTPDPTPAPTEDPNAGSNPFAGEYEFVITTPEGDETIAEEFIVDPDGKLHGVGDASGMTSFEGTVNEDGTFTGEFTRLGGTMQGTIDADGNITGTGEIRGRNYTYAGSKLD